MNLNASLIRVLAPMAVVGIVLTGCSSASSAEGSASPSDAPGAASPMAASMKAEEPMAEESMAEESMATQDESMMAEESMKAEEPMAADGPGSYITLADYTADPESVAGSNVVLFFHADWCPTCQGTEKDLTENADAIPAGLTIVKVDYDDSDDLKRQYGVTTQHTFVQVDAEGNEIAKWSGSETSADIAANLS